MPPRRSHRLTPLELEIMKVLWTESPANVQSVRDRLAAERDLAYNTVQTMLNVLHRKGRVTRKLVGRAYEYAPAVTRGQAARHAISDLVHRMFDDSAESLVLSLVETKKLTAEKLTELAAMVERAEEDSRGRR